MQRDQKIGLALGILLVGAVAAFFFRHEEAPGDPLPALQTSEALDQRIAERDRAPYLQTGEEEVPTATADPFVEAEPQPGGLVPEPIPLGAEDASWQPTSLANAPATPPSSATSHHIVQRGETLSSIAEQYLGSAVKYNEIFLANVDRLRDANDLRVGMELRIPSRQMPPAARTAVLDERRTARDGSAVERPGRVDVPIDDANGVPKFEPYRRSPLTPQGTDPQSSAIDPKEAARRKLTQSPPRDGVSAPR